MLIASILLLVVEGIEVSPETVRAVVVVERKFLFERMMVFEVEKAKLLDNVIKCGLVT